MIDIKAIKAAAEAATPQPRKAVKLSDSEVREIYENHAYVDCTGMLRAIEAAVWAKLGVEE